MPGGTPSGMMLPVVELGGVCVVTAEVERPAFEPAGPRIRIAFGAHLEMVLDPVVADQLADALVDVLARIEDPPVVVPAAVVVDGTGTGRSAFDASRYLPGAGW